MVPRHEGNRRGDVVDGRKVYDYRASVDYLAGKAQLSDVQLLTTVLSRRDGQHSGYFVRRWAIPDAHDAPSTAIWTNSVGDLSSIAVDLGATDALDPHVENVFLTRAKALAFLSTRAEWDESEHPRDDHGRFEGDGGGDVSAPESGGGGEDAAPKETTGTDPKFAAMSLDELTSYLSNNGNIWLENDTGTKTGRTQEVAANIVTTIDRLRQSPIMAASLQGYQNPTKISLVKGAYVRAEGGRRTFAHYRSTEKRLTIATGLRLSNVAAKPGIGKELIGKDLPTVTAHELGHQAMGKIIIEAKKNGWSHESITQLFQSKSKAVWEKAVSKYSATDPHELFAEAFAAWTHPGYQQGKALPPELVSLFEKAGVKKGG